MLSGTSMDGLDTAVCEIEVPDGATEHADRGAASLTVLGHRSAPWPADLQERLLAVLPPARTTVEEIASLDNAVGQAAGRAADQALEAVGVPGDLVAWLGQTVFHGIAGGTATGGLQLGQPAWIAEATGLPVVSDLRATDIAAGGHGAPLASTLDALWLATGERTIALNLGGIANITVVAPTIPHEGNPHPARATGSSPHGRPTVIAYDTGPANCWLDVVAHRATGVPYDVDGALAASGTVDDALLDHLLAEPYYAARPPKTTGRELFTAAALDAAVAATSPGIEPADLAATLVALTARTVADACRAHGPVEVVGSGGGMDNPVLRAALAEALAPTRLVYSDERGLPSAAKEAVLTALLGALTWHGVPGVRPGATGSHTARVLGRISPGRRPLRLPEPVGAVHALRIGPPRGEDPVALGGRGVPSCGSGGVQA
ncbi:anhydro-N-acetylmuramic acid kinase [Actinomycetospora endophytica]|uniref:Anhydro-N-acetylmuramic acid kinase n=1 Tax=Actinomycetospora endophytica TaxID=2291215 RepID=A0ABS8PEP1_9PSEU|nr:anhydro-N-acetylmuramic acid kinase [Actinomycetospora endophytica]MCD2196624.1 anhydro-N-acetylmuramic acid kinase [Actinomycetospora endophytica]